MAATCPAGHESATDDYCDTCGAPIGAATASEAANEGEAAGAVAGDGAATAEGQAEAPDEATCPGCGEPVVGRFCESCGFDVEKGQPAAPPPVSLQLGADRAHWERMVGEGEPAFPAAVPALSFELAGDRLVLGRVRAGPPVDVDLALTGSAADPAVSHQQCVFERDGATWTVRDLGSANGTWINDAEEPLADGDTHALVPGDRILMGAWTSLTVQAVASPAADPSPAAPPAPDPT
jgi:hypothetical protein